MTFADRGLQELAGVVGTQRRKAQKTVSQPNFGLYLDLAPAQVPARGLVGCLNIQIKDGQITNEDVGWEILNSGWTLNQLLPVLSNYGRATQVLLATRFENRDGTEVLVLGTQKDIYEWIGTQFMYLNPIYAAGTSTVDVSGGGVVTYNSGTATLWDTTPAGASRPNVRAGDYFIENDYNVRDPEKDTPSTWHEIASVQSDTQFTLATGAGIHVNSEYTIRQCFDGDEADIWSTADFPDAQPDDVDLLFGTNGREHWKWDRDDDEITLVQPASGTVTSKLLYRHQNILIYGHVTEGEIKRQTIKCSDLDIPEELGLGNAVELAISNGSSPLVALLTLGEYLIAYFEGAISVLEYVGPPVQWIIRSVQSEVGLVSRRAVIDRGDTHEFLALQGGFMFDGQSLQPLAPQVFQKVMREQYDPSRNYKAVAVLDESKGQVIWSVPLATDPEAGDLWGAPQVRWVTHYDEYVGRRPVPVAKLDLFGVTALGTWERDDGAAALLFSDFVDADLFSTSTDLWASRYFGEKAPLVVFGDDAGKVFVLGHSHSQDGIAPVCFARHPRFPVYDGRLDGMIDRLEPYIEDEPGSSAYTVSLRIWGGDRMNGALTLLETLEYDATGSGNRFLDPRVAARFAEIEVYTDGANEVWTEAGYTVDASAMGER